MKNAMNLFYLFLVNLIHFRRVLRVHFAVTLFVFTASFTLLSGCLEEPPSGSRFSCESATDCPDGWSCEGNLCRDGNAPIVLSIDVKTPQVGPNGTLKVAVRTAGESFAELIPRIQTNSEQGRTEQIALLAVESEEDALYFELPLAEFVSSFTNREEYRVFVQTRVTADSDTSFSSVEGSFHYDDTPPQLLLNNEDLRINGQSAAVLTLSGAESLAAEALPQLAAVNASQSCVLTFSTAFSSERSQLYFTLDANEPLPADFSERCISEHGRYTLRIYSAYDEALNLLHDENETFFTFTLPLEVDDRPPNALFSVRRNPLTANNNAPPVLSPSFAGQEVVFCAEQVTDRNLDVENDVYSETVDLLIQFAEEELQCIPEQNNCDLECSWIQPEDFRAESGYQKATLSARDEVQNLKDITLDVAVDFEGPELTGIPFIVPNTTLRPGQKRNVNLEPESLGMRSTLVLAMGANENAYFSPEGEKAARYFLACGPLKTERALTLLDAPQFSEAESQKSLTFVLQNVFPRVRQDCDVVVEIEDAYGNRSENILSTITLDTERPDANDTLHLESLSHTRFPWGIMLGVNVQNASVQDIFDSYERRGQAILHISDDPAELGSLDLPAETFGSLSGDEALAFIRVYDSQEGKNEIGRIVYLPNLDKWKQLPFTTTDAAELWLTAVDDAGNESEARKRIDSITWIATLGGKVAGSTVENPHRLLAQASFQDNAAPFGAREIAFSTEDIDANIPTTWPEIELYESGQDAHLFKGRGTWSQMGNDDVNASLGLSYASAAYDGDRGLTVFFGGGTQEQGDSPVNWLSEWNGLRFVSRCDGEPIGDACTHLPSPRAGHESIWHPKKGGIWLVGGCNNLSGTGTGSLCKELLPEVWRWNGKRFEDLCADGDCENTARIRHRLAYDEANGELYLFGGCLNSNCSTLDNQLYRWNESGFDVVSIAEPLPTARAESAFFYDPTQDELVLAGGCTSYSQRKCTSNATDLWILSLSDNDPTWNDRTANLSENIPSGAEALRSVFIPSDPTDVREGTHLVVGVAETKVYNGANRDFRALSSSTDALGDGDPYAPLAPLDENAPNDAPLDAGFVFAWDNTKKQSWLNDAQAGLWTPFINGAGTQLNLGWNRFRFAAGNIWPNARRRATLLLDPTSRSLILMGDSPTNEAETWSFNGFQWRKKCSQSGAANNCGFQGAAIGASLISNTALPSSIPIAIGTAGANKMRVYREDEWINPTFLLGNATSLINELNIDGTLMRSSTLNHGVYLSKESNTFAMALEVIAQQLVVKWNLVPSNLSPAAVVGAVSSYNASQNKALLFGGCTDASGCNTQSSDLWSIQTSGSAGNIEGQWLPISATGDVPASRAYSSLEYDSERERTVLYGGCAGQNCVARYFGDLYEYHNTGNNTGIWVKQKSADPNGDGNPVARAEAMAASSPTGGMLLLGGTNGQRNNVKNKLNDFWIWDGGFSTAPAHIFEVNFQASGAPADAEIELTTLRWVGAGTSPIENRALLKVWERGRWVLLDAENTGNPQALGLSAYPRGTRAEVLRQTGNSRFKTWLHGAPQKMRFALSPFENQNERSSLTSAYVEVVVRYRLPPMSP